MNFSQRPFYTFSYLLHFMTMLAFSKISQLVFPLCLYAESCPTLCGPMDCGLSGSSVHGIFKARLLEWVAISYSRGSSWPKDQTLVSCISYISRQILYYWCHQGSPLNSLIFCITSFSVYTSLSKLCVLCLLVSNSLGPHGL